MKFVSRRAWGARAARSSSSLASTRGVKVHYVGGAVDVRLAADHARCAAMVRNIQRHHMDTNGWADIAYNALVCPHGHVFEGRGPHRMSAANGPGRNTAHYAVCGLVGSTGLTKPSDAMLGGIRDAIDWLRAKGAAGSEIKGHRDGYPTSCPGEPLYRWVRAGAPRPTEDDMPLTDAEIEKIARKVLTLDGVIKAGDDGTENAHWTLHWHIYDTNRRLRAVEKTVTALAARSPGTTTAVAEALSGLSPATLAQQLATALPPEAATQLVTELNARLDGDDPATQEPTPPMR